MQAPTSRSAVAAVNASSDAVEWPALCRPGDRSTLAIAPLALAIVRNRTPSHYQHESGRQNQGAQLSAPMSYPRPLLALAAASRVSRMISSRLSDIREMGPPTVMTALTRSLSKMGAETACRSGRVSPVLTA